MFKNFLVFSAVLILTAIPVRVVYLEEIRYSAPTPVPAGYSPIEETVFVDPPVPELVSKEKPLFIHFFNPECPCSRFNMEQFAEIVRKFKGEADFFVVIQSAENLRKDFFAKWDIEVPHLADRNGLIAKAYGVYSTPQAVILDSRGKLFFRGNYNKSRYCALKTSEYARIALEAVLRQEKIPSLPVSARIAYGCELPVKEWERKKIKFLDEFFGIY